MTNPKWRDARPLCGMIFSKTHTKAYTGKKVTVNTILLTTLTIMSTEITRTIHNENLMLQVWSFTFEVTKWNELFQAFD